MPRCSHIWVFGSWFGQSYADNSKWLFESVCKNEPLIRAIWLTRKHKVVSEVRKLGYEAYMINSWKGYWLACRSGIAVACWGKSDLNRVAISCAKKIQLWHGSPMKKIVLDDKYAQIDPRSFVGSLHKLWKTLFPFAVEKWDVVIACSEVFKKYMMSAYGMRESQVKITGYPRNDVLLNKNLSNIPYIEDLIKMHKVKNILLYAPTFRNKKKDMDNLFETFNIDIFEDILRKYDAILLIKMHYVYLNSPHAINLKGQKSRIYWLDENSVPEINPLLNYTNILITDYSGVYFDFLLLDRPLVFAPFDLEQYLADDRELYDDYSNFAIAGPKCRNWHEVMEECRKILSSDDKYLEERKKAQKQFNSFVDAKNCSRVIEVLKDVVNLKKG